MLQFSIDPARCIRCGLCAVDCPVRIIDLEKGLPAIADEKENACLRCQHCFAICPTAALSILGKHPGNSLDLERNTVDPTRLETLIRGRRSVRRFKQENLPAADIQKCLDVAWQAPTGANWRGVLWTVIDDKEALKRFRVEAYDGLATLIRAGQLPEHQSLFVKFVALWQERGVDVMFRDAPHLLFASAPKASITPQADCLIALSYFELYAHSLGIGTLWNGFIQWTVDELLPALQGRLGIPEDHQVGYAMLFGPPAIRYIRTIDHGPTRVNRVDF